MELKPGYKQTEVGIIPSDWDVRIIRDVCTLINGRGFKPYEWRSSGLPIIRIQNLNGSDDFNYYAGIYNPKIVVENNQLLFAWSGSRGTSFGPHIWTSHKALLNYHTWKVDIDVKKIDAQFFFYALRHLTSSIEDAAHGASALVHTQKGEMEQLPLAIPSLPEQRAIAAALSDTDTLLSSLGHLLAKKRDIKRAVMQQLLTGRQRLPGFSGEWEAKRLGEIFDMIAGISKSKYIKDAGRYLVVDMGSISTEGKLIASKPTDHFGDFLKHGDLVMPKDDIGGGNIIGKAAYIDKDEQYVLGDHVYALKARMGNSLFLSYLINANETNSALRKKVSGSAQLGLGRKSVEEQLIPFPSPDEQTAIAAVLSDMDAEIDALTQRRDKTRALKQGMMQELLTGRTRLV